MNSPISTTKRILLFFLALAPCTLSATAGTIPHSLAENLIDTLSPYDVLRCSKTIDDRFEKKKIEARGMELFIAYTSSQEKRDAWLSEDPMTRQQVTNIVLSGIDLLLEGDLSSATELKSTPFAPSQDSWNKYLFYTSHLPNRKLPIWTPSKLPQEAGNIDLLRTLFNEYHNPSPYSLTEVALDIVAADVLARKQRSPTTHFIDLMNHLIFDELRVRFPPKSTSEAYIDKFTNIEEIVSSKRGVCLGVCVMYLAVVQRLGLDYTIYTPPGHIFLATTVGHKERVIETTARGIHLPLSRYLDARIGAVPQRRLIEVVGMVLINDASRCIRTREYQKAIDLYQRAEKYMISDLDILFSYTGFALFMSGKTSEAQKLAKLSLKNVSPLSYDVDPLAHDISYGLFDQEGGELFIRALQHDSSSQEKMFLDVKNYLKARPAAQQPLLLMYMFVDLSLSMADTKSALTTLEAIYKKKDPSSVGLPTLLLLAELSLKRYNLPQSLQYIEVAQAFLLEKQQRAPHPLNTPQEFKDIKLYISKKSPGSLIL